MNDHSVEKISFSRKQLTQSALIAALYIALTLVFKPISFGVVQVRIAEALCILPYFTFAAVPGLFVGCLLANFLGGAAIWDVIFGSLATLLAAVLSYRFKKLKYAVCIFPILINTLVIPWVLRFVYQETLTILVLAGSIFIGELIAVGVLGSILLFALDKQKLGLQEFFEG
ncbi:hypothetical protein FACS189418_8010 [Clostridia bacterium]|nr:hypothetical protein FACS189418_8010 [Clostridia bacterium]